MPEIQTSHLSSAKEREEMKPLTEGEKILLDALERMKTWAFDAEDEWVKQVCLEALAKFHALPDGEEMCECGRKNKFHKSWAGPGQVCKYSWQE